MLSLQKMKTVVTYILISLLVLIYSIGMIGIGVYHCHCGHNGQVALLTDIDCTCRHQHAGCHDYDQYDYDQEQTTGQSCCKINYLALQLDQEISDAVVVSTINYNSIVNLLFLPVNLIKIPAPGIFSCHNCDPPPLEIAPLPNIYCLAQLRL